MLNEDTFLTPQQSEAFARRGRLIPRSIAEFPLDKDEGRPRASVPMVAHLLGRLKSLVEDGRLFECACIQVRKDDGMTWSAEAVNTAVRAEHRHLARWCLARRLQVDALPVAARIVGVTMFLRFAVAEQVTTSFFTLRSWVTPAIIGAAIAVGAAIKLAESVVRSGGDAGLAGLGLPVPAPYLAAAGAAALGLLSQYFTTVLTTKSRSRSIESFLRHLDQKEKSVPYDRFIDRVAARMARLTFPRCVIVDDFEALDRTTRRVIARYFEFHAQRASGLEFWVIFDRPDGERFSDLVAADRPPSGGYGQTRLYRQMLLTEAERRTVAEGVGRPERAAFSTVKQICTDSAEADKRLGELLHEHREHHPRRGERYGDLEFLHLLAFAALPDPTPLTRRFLVNNLAAKSGLCHDVLRQLLHKTTFRKDEYQDRVDSIAHAFPSLVEVEAAADLTKLTVGTEAALALERMTDELKLPRPGLGHLFWSLFWPETAPGRAQEAYWIRKVTYHLQRADASLVADPTVRARVSGRLIEINLSAVEASLRTCLFADIVSLLERAVLLASSDDHAPDPAVQRRMLRECWKAYSVLGDERILSLILELSPRAIASWLSAGDGLSRLFVESMVLPPGRRALLEAPAADGPACEAMESATDHARVRAAWLVLSMAGAADLEGPVLWSAWFTAMVDLDRLVKRTSDRLTKASETGVRVTDVLTLSLGLWCHALRPSLDSTPGGRETRHQDFGRLLERAQDAALVARELRNESGVGPGSARRPDLVMGALAQELSAVGLASVVAAYRRMADQEPGDDRVSADDRAWLDRVNDLLAGVTEATGSRLPHLQALPELTDPAFLRAVAESMTIASILWDHFELKRLHDFLLVRRLQFTVDLRDTPDGGDLDDRALTAAVDAMLPAGGFTALVACVALAASLQSSGELVAYYLDQAARLVLADDFGDGLKDDTAALAVAIGHRYAWDLTPLVDRLVSESPGRPSFIARLVQEPEEALRPPWVLRLLNTRRSITDETLRSRVMDAVEALIASVADDGARDELVALRDAHAVAAELKAGRPLDVPALLDSWQHRKHLWPYPSVLNSLIVNGHGSEPLLDEATHLLDRDPDADTYNSYLLLAVSVARAGLARNIAGGPAAAVAYIKTAAPRWTGRLPVDENLAMYWALHELDPDQQAAYRAEILKWEAIKIRRDHLRSLPQLIERGAFYLLFEYYWRFMVPRGLRVDAPSVESLPLGEIEPERRAVIVRDWKAAGAPVPSPLGRDTHGVLVSVEYLRIGQSIFQPPLDQDAALDDDRRRFNQAARGALRPLVEAIIALPALPPATRDLLQTYARRLLDRTPPEE